jgi:hypothetical protein
LLLPGFQKGRNIEDCQGKRQGAVWDKKEHFAVKNIKKLEKIIEFHTFFFMFN